MHPSHRFCSICCSDPREGGPPPPPPTPTLLRFFFLLDASSSSRFSAPGDEEEEEEEEEEEASDLLGFEPLKELAEKAMNPSDSFFCPGAGPGARPAANLLDPLAIFLSRVARKLNLAFPPPGFSPELASDSDSDSDLLRAAGVLALSVADLSSSPSCCRGALDAPGSVKEVLEHTKHLYTCDNNTHTHTHTVISNYTYTLTRHTSQHYSLYYSYSLLATHYSLLATHYATLHYTTHYTTLLTTPTHYTTLHYSPLHS